MTTHGEVLSGAATAAHVISNADALRVAPLLDDAEVAALVAAWRVAPAQYWDERAQLAWN